MAPYTNAKTYAEEGKNEEQLSGFDPEDLIGSILKRQVSAPASPSSKGSGEPDEEPDEEDDTDLFQSISSANRQLSGYGMDDWAPIRASNINRQQTDEHWPTWYGSDPLAETEPATVPYSAPQVPEPCLPTWMMPQFSSHDVDMHSIGAMLQNGGAARAWQLEHQTRQEARNNDFIGRKRESLIDLAKQKQEQENANRQAAEGIKFCPWCGGKFQPSFKFCIFCGKAFTGVPK